MITINPMSNCLMTTPSPTGAFPSHWRNKPSGRRKILFFYQDFGQMGGIERYLLNLGQALVNSDDFEPVFLCSDNTPLFHQLKALGCPVYGVQSPAFFARSFLRSLDLFALRALKRVIKTESIDIAHVHIGLLEISLLKRWGCAVVFTFHGYGSLYSDRFAKHPLQRCFKNMVKLIFQKTVKGLDQLLIVSFAEQKRLIREGFLSSQNSGQVLHNGVSMEKIQQEMANNNPVMLRTALGLKPDSRIIAFVNRLDTNKNPDHFLALAARFALHPQFADCEFLIAGDGPLRPMVEAACQSLPNTRYLGYQSDISALFSLTDVLIYPALAEGFGLGLVEAMAGEVLCLAYASEGAGEILETPQTDSCLVPVGDLDALENQLKGMLNLSIERQQSLKTTLKERASAFDLQASIRQLTQVYNYLTPQISILLPVYNGADCVLKAVRSVLSQTYAHWELIIIDDGSTDATLDLLSRFVEVLADERVRVIHQRNQGVAVARNNGFTQAQGDYIAFLDADDVWLPHKLAEEVAVLRAKTTSENPACLVYSSYFAVNEANQLINLPVIHQENGHLAEAVLAHEGIFLPSTSLVHRSIFESLGGFQSACYHEDRVFFIQACQQFPAYPTGKRLVLYRQSLSGRCRSVLKDYEQALTAELSIVTTLRDTLTESQLALLSLRQRRNLFYRFLMYNGLQSAQRLYQEMSHDHSLLSGLDDCFQGRKGQLAKLSLKTGINFLYLARLWVQGLMKVLPVFVLSPAVEAALVKETSDADF